MLFGDTYAGRTLEVLLVNRILYSCLAGEYSDVKARHKCTKMYVEYQYTKLIKSRMNVKYTLLQNKANKTYDFYPNKWLIRGSNLEKHDWLLPHQFTDLTFATPTKVTRDSSNLYYVEPFPTQMWAAVVVTLSIVTVAYLVLSKWRIVQFPKRNVLKFIVGTLLKQDVDTSFCPSNLSYNILLVVWIIYICLIGMFFNAKITATITKFQETTSIATVPQLFNAVQNNKYSLSVKYNKSIKKFLTQMFPDREELLATGFNRPNNALKHAMIEYRAFLNFFVSSRRAFNPPIKYSISADSFLHTQFAMLLKKRLYCYEYLLYILVRLTETGIVQHWNWQAERHLLIFELAGRNLEIRPTYIEQSDVDHLMWIYSCSALFSIAVFLVEVFTRLCRFK